MRATLPADEERLANIRLLSDEELRRKTIKEMNVAREHEVAMIIDSIKPLARMG